MATHKPAVIIAGTAQDLPSGDGLQDIASIESGLVLNDAGAAVNFRVEGDTASQLLLVDGANDAVKIGTSTAGEIATFSNTGLVLNSSKSARGLNVYGAGGTGSESLFSVGGSQVNISDQSSFGAGGTAVFHAGAAILNSAGNDFDFQLSGDTLTHMIFTDGSAATENIALVAGSAPNWQNMDRGLFLGDASTAPTGNPSSGLFLWSDSGVLKCRSSAGAVSTISKIPQIDVFTGSGTWTKPAGAVSVDRILIGAGGGGGSGRIGASGVRGGGGGGGGGGYSFDSNAASKFGATETITVGAGGAGGANTGSPSTNGNAGTAGGNTSMTATGSGGSTLTANGGGAGGAGTTSAGAGGSGGTGAGSVSATGGSGGNGGGSGAATAPGSVTGKMAGAGGGAASGIDGSGSQQVGTSGGNSGGTGGLVGPSYNALNFSLPGYPGLPGPCIMAGTQAVAFGGGGGGGGSTSTAGTGAPVGVGGAGGTFGGGGGGGCAGTDSAGVFNPGGTGGGGIAIVVTYFQ